VPRGGRAGVPAAAGAGVGGLAVTREQELAERLAALEQRLDRACAAAGRARDAVALVAVTKFHPASDIASLRDLGVSRFGESRDQEAQQKAAEVVGVRWHFVGRLQTNKAASVAAYASVVESCDRLRLVSALAAGAVRAEREVEVLVQVSLDGDPSRGGAPAADVPALADAVAAAEGLRLSGVMAVAPLDEEPARAFGRLAELAERLRRDHPDSREVSAGMSADLEQAVASGSTSVRVGTALLGPRPPALR
jgi:pyridoxal phosphate enzyme (YggS family)